MKRIFLFVMIIFSLPSICKAQEQPFQWRIGEELAYKVRWSFIRLGTLRLVVDDTVRMNTQLLHHVKLYIDSNPMLFFVNMHSVYESFIDDRYRTHLFLADEKIDNIPYKTEYRFDYTDSLIYANYTSVEDPTKTIIKQMPLDEWILDGTSMIFYARANVNETRTDTVTSFFEAKRGQVVLNFKGRKKDIHIGSTPESISTYFVDGTVKMKAIAGLTGPYKGWFATDAQRPPLRAELKVFIGSVIVELESWKNWNQ